KCMTTTRDSIGGALGVAPLDALTGENYADRAQRHRPTDPAALAAEVRRLNCNGMSPSGYCSRLKNGSGAHQERARGRHMKPTKDHTAATIATPSDSAAPDDRACTLFDSVTSAAASAGVASAGPQPTVSSKKGRWSSASAAACLAAFWAAHATSIRCCTTSSRRYSMAAPPSRPHVATTAVKSTHVTAFNWNTDCTLQQRRAG